MKFTLRYTGTLPSVSNSNRRLREKWAIRRQLHPQLVQLWKTEPGLRELAQHRVFGSQGDLLRFQLHPQTYSRLTRESSSRNAPAHREIDLREEFIDLCPPLFIDSRQFFPLTRASLGLVCDLNILFLRPGDPGSLIGEGGDLDNRLKVLFDGLRMPTRGEMAGAEDLPGEPLY